MSGQGRISRRGLLGAAAAVGAASLAGRASETHAAAPASDARRRGRRPMQDRPAAQLPARGDFVVRGGYVLTMDPALGDLPRGDVHVRDGAIVAVGTDLAAPGAAAIDAQEMIVLPGLVETHWHLWNSTLRGLVADGPTDGYFAVVLRHGQVYTPEDAYRGVRLGLAEALYSGITTVHDWSHNIRGPAWADADLRALTDVGIRARFSYGTRQGHPSDDTMDLPDLARVQREWFARPGEGLLTLGMAAAASQLAARPGPRRRAAQGLGGRPRARSADHDPRLAGGGHRGARPGRSARPGHPARPLRERHARGARADGRQRHPPQHEPAD